MEQVKILNKYYINLNYDDKKEKVSMYNNTCSV